ncbi:MAG: citrate synthase [Planctomycetes bacterium]|nr:citrate synthase [Planctomycetota bacterium]HPF15585.1 citrate synthase [Planctomycetota bacterium]
MTQTELVPGLAGIPAAESSISFINGQEGLLSYRGIRIEELAAHSNFEEVICLLWDGTLPTQAALDAFKERLRPHSKLHPDLERFVRALPLQGHPMEALQASLATLGMVSPRVDLRDPVARLDACLRTMGAVSTLIAAAERHRKGLPLVEPDPNLSIAGNFLYCLNGERPDAIKTRVLDCALVLHAEHTMNASTFACRVVASTETNPYTATSAAVGALYGPLHGGANERVLVQLESIGGPENVSAWVDKKMAAKEKVMGFGHRVYKTKDPRAKNLQILARELFEIHGSTPLYDTALRLEEEVTARLGGKGIYPNVDFFSGIVYQKLGIPTDVFTPIFALSRMAGWLAHWMEQMEDNKLFRPGQIYTGRKDVSYVPIGQRSAAGK